MKNFKKLYYILLPLTGFAINYLLFAYGCWNNNPGEWNETARQMSAFAGVLFITAGGLLAYEINDNNAN